MKFTRILENYIVTCILIGDFFYFAFLCFGIDCSVMNETIAHAVQF